MKIYLKQALWFVTAQYKSRTGTLKCDCTNSEIKLPDTIPEKSTLKFHPHSSWHLHYQILHSNLGQKRELPIAFLQKTHIHLQQPLERKAKITLGNFFQTRYKAALIEPADEKLLTATEHQLQTFTPKTGRPSQDPFWQHGPLAIKQDYTKITLFKLQTHGLHVLNKSIQGLLNSGTGCPEMMESPSLWIFKAWLDKILSDLVLRWFALC